MKITVEINNKKIANLVCSAIKDAAYSYEVKREESKEAFERVQSSEIAGNRKDHRLHYYARRGAEAKLISDTLWDVAMAIDRQARDMTEEG